MTASAFDQLSDRPYLASGSEIDRLLVCTGGKVLPGAGHVSGDSSCGVTIHHFLYRTGIIGRDGALDELEHLLGAVNEEEVAELEPSDQEILDVCRVLPVERIPEGLQPEVAMGWNLRTDEVRVLGSGLQRAYGHLGPEWVVKTADLFSLEGGVRDHDYKTGVQRKRARHSGQLGLGAVIGSKLLGRDSAEVANVYVRRSGDFAPDFAELGPMDLDAWEDRVRSLPGRILQGEQAVADGDLPELVSGEHCRYCPAAARCPELAGRIRAFVHPPEILRLIRSVPELSTEELSAAVSNWKLAEPHLKKLGEALKLRADEQPIPQPGGMEFRPVFMPGWVETPAAKEELRQHREELKERGQIYRTAGVQYRVVAASSEQPAARADDEAA